MSDKLLLGVDIGTQGSKGVVCDVHGRVMASAYIEHTIHAPFPGWAEQDADDTWWGAFVSLVKEMLGKGSGYSSRIAAVGVSGLVPNMLPLDERGKPVRRAILHTDRRATRELSELREQLTDAGCAEIECGPIALASPVPQLLWVRRHEPETYRRISKIVQCQGYLVYRLTGQIVVDHAMKRSFAPLYDARTGGWSSERAALVGIRDSLLPDRIAWASEVAGRVHKVAADETGIPVDTPVAVGTADSFAEALGAGVVTDGAAAGVYGSWTFILIGHNKQVSPWQGTHCLPGVYLSGAGVPTGAALTRWFRDQFGQAELALQRTTGESAYASLDHQAACIPPGCDGLVALPYFTGERSRLHAAVKQGALIGLDVNTSRPHIYRALLEGTAYELRFQLAEANETLRRMNAVGGGARSELWMQIVCDVLSVQQDVLAVPYGAPYGDAYIAGMAAGCFQDTGPLQQEWIRVERRVRPNQAHSHRYKESYDAYCAIRHSMLGEHTP